jgi:hypothetical protein
VQLRREAAQRKVSTWLHLIDVFSAGLGDFGVTSVLNFQAGDLKYCTYELSFQVLFLTLELFVEGD